MQKTDEQALIEAMARAICRAAITHEVVGEGVPDAALEQMIENLTIKYLPEARAAHTIAKAHWEARVRDEREAAPAALEAQAASFLENAAKQSKRAGPLASGYTAAAQFLRNRPTNQGGEQP